MRSHYTHEVNESQIDQSITLCGWVHRRRDHGGLVFIDLRDNHGLVQVVCDPEIKEPFATAGRLRNEFVIQVTGTIRRRPDGTINKDLPSGTVELIANQLNILNTSSPLPFNVDDYQEVGEEARLRYRYIDLRRPEVAEKIKLRSRLVREIRHYLDQHDFLDIETPMLTRSTPEGARDYLVPSRNYPGKFYALPQSPQLFKQLLMMSGFERYYQIVKCFRDEDLRADRQPEFTQLDMEMAFVEETAIQNLVEGLLRHLFKTLINVDLPTTIERITYHDAIKKYGTDRPDLRIPLELVDLADVMQQVEFKVFHAPANDPEGRVAALRLPKGAALTRKQIDDYTKFVGIYGAKGLAYIKVTDKSQGRDGLQSPILKFLPDAVISEILERTQAHNDDIIFFGADKAHIVNEALGALRTKLGQDLNLFQCDWYPVWVTDFPMFASSDRGEWEALHHPFTAPQVHDAEELRANPGKALSRAYDIVLNGSEIGGGSIRIHDSTIQQAALEILGIDQAQAQQKFGFLLKALQYGCPPHGGIAFGLDRIAMIMSQSQSIREVIAFPKTQTAHCPLTDAPSEVGFEQLRELAIKTTVKKAPTES